MVSRFAWVWLATLATGAGVVAVEAAVVSSAPISGAGPNSVIGSPAPGAPVPGGGEGIVTIRNAATGKAVYDDNAGIARMTKDVTVTQAGQDFILYAQDLTYNRFKNQAVATGDLRVETRDSTITGTRLFADFNTRVITMQGDVVINSHGEKDGIAAQKKGFRGQLAHKPSTLLCDRVDWDYEIHQAVVTGHIHMAQGDNGGTCDRIVFDETTNVADLQGNVNFADGQHRKFLCSQLTVYVDSNKVGSTEPCTVSFPRDTQDRGTPRPAKTPVAFAPPPEITAADIDQFNQGVPTGLGTSATPAVTPPAKIGGICSCSSRRSSRRRSRRSSRRSPWRGPRWLSGGCARFPTKSARRCWAPRAATGSRTRLSPRWCRCSLINMLLDQVTEEIRRSADIVEVVGQYVSLKPAGPGRFKACCPFHDEKTPSFNVSRDKGFYKCFGCGVAGDVFTFLQNIENLTFPEARAALAGRYGIAIPEKRELSEAQRAQLSERERLWKLMSAAADFFREQFTGNKGLAARDYARSRGLSRETLEKFGIGYAPDSWDALRRYLLKKGHAEDDVVRSGLLIEKRPAAQEGQTPAAYPTPEAAQAANERRTYDRYRHRLMFPIWDESGRVIAFGGRALPGSTTSSTDAKYINSPEGLLFHKSRLLYAWHLARAEVSKRESVIVTEGYMDTVALHAAGLGNTVATLGTAMTPHHVALLGRLKPGVVYLCFDGDSAGIKAALRTAPLFAEHALPVRVVQLPPEHDPDTWVKANGVAGMEQLLREAPTLGQYRLETLFLNWPQLPVEQHSRILAEAAQIVNDTQDNLERDGYKNWLVDRLLSFENLPTRREQENRRDSFARIIDRELAEDERRQGPQERVVTARNVALQGAGQEERIPAPSVTPREGEGRPALEFIPGPRRKYGPPDPNAGVRAEKKQYISQLMMEVKSAEAAPGVLRAQKHLVGALLGHPAWRSVILEGLPLERWTGEVFGEVLTSVKALEPGAEVVPGPFCQELSPEAAAMVGEVMLSDEAAELPDSRIINDWIFVVQRFWARRAERELRELVVGKLQRNEPVSPAEREALLEAQAISGRKAPVPAK